MTFVHEAFLAGLTAPRPAYAHSGRSRLYVSEFGRCPRRAMLRILNYQPSAPFAPTLLEAMGLGMAYEMDSAIQLSKSCPTLIQQLTLANSTWSGKADFMIPGKLDTIIEHKGANSQWFDYQGKLPQHENVSQVWLYGELYKEIHHKPVRLILYYRAWGHYAEFEIEADPNGDVVTCTGLVDGEKRTRSWEAGLGVMRRFMEEHYAAGTVPELPACGANEKDGCLWRGEPSCGYHAQCWGPK